MYPLYIKLRNAAEDTHDADLRERLNALADRVLAIIGQASVPSDIAREAERLLALDPP